MGKLELENILNEKTGNCFGFKLKSASLEKATGLCFVDFFYNDGTILSQEKRNEAEDILKSILPKGFEYEIKFTKNFVVNESVENIIREFFKHKFPSVLYNILKIDCEQENKHIEIGVEEKVYDYVLDHKVEKVFEDYLKECFMADIKVTIKVDAGYREIVVEEQDFDFEIFDPAKSEDRFIEVTEVEPLVGEFKDALAYYIKDKKVPEDNVVVCGKILFIKEYAYQVKSKAIKEEKENKTDNVQKDQEEKQIEEVTNDANSVNEEEHKNERKYFKFSIEDFTGKLSCVFFANKNNVELMHKLEPGHTVIIEGKLEPDTYSGGVSMRVKNISKCVLPETFEEKINYKPEPKSYKFVFPEKVELYTQGDLFSVEEKKVDEFLLNNDVVVFDFETTGLNLDGSDKIIEIGAVKVVKGKITEKFMCFIDPEMKIPAEASKIHGIFDVDVKGANTYDQVLADFYKFTRNSYLSGYNIKGFDMVFLQHFGKLSGYNFDNPLLDVYPLAQKLLKGLKNYKLGTVAAHLGVVLDNAHRAVFDTIATAEVLLKLSEIEPISLD